MDHAALTRTLSAQGILTRGELLARGIDDHGVAAALRTGHLVRLRRGWYARPGVATPVVSAAAVGGTLTCCSALALLSVWAPVGTDLHVRRPSPRRPVPLPAGVVECRTDLNPPGHPPVDSPLRAWQIAVRCLGIEEAVACTDSALRLGLISRSNIDALPATRRHHLRFVDPRAESGTESLVRTRLQRRNIRVTPQVVIPGVGRVDLLVGERLVIECDSRAHHTDRAAYWNDRRRDRELAARGYQCIRLTWEDVMFDWEAALQHILILVRSGEHRVARRYRDVRPCG